MADAHPSNRLARGVPTRRRDRRLLFVIMLMMSATGCRNGEMPLAGIPGLDDIIRAPGDDGARNRPPDHLIPLYEWYSAARGDHFTTSDPDWAGEPGIERAGYRLVRIAGYVFDPARPQPQNTIPMVSWYSPGRGDNFLTTQVNNYEPEYRRVRLEGYVFAQSYAGTVPLHRWYNRERTDNFTTTSPFWQGAIGEARQGYVKSRVAGHLYPPPPAEGDAVAFGWGSTRATGIRPLLVIHQDLATHRVQRDAAWFEELIFGERRATHPATVPVHTWWNADTRRSIATTHADWAGQAADRRAPEYGFHRLEGYVFDQASAPNGTVPLYSWFSGARDDNRLTGAPGWLGPVGAQQAGYGCSRLEGFVYDPALPQPPGTDPLYSWYSPERGDHVTTSDPAWAPQGNAQRQGYRFQRIEGYVPSTRVLAPPGTAGLHTWWDHIREDYFTTASEAWVGEGASERQGYRYDAARIRAFDPVAAAPGGTVPLRHWTSDDGRSYTTTRAFEGGAPAGYRMSRLDGHLFDPARNRPAGAVPVRSFFNPQTRDHQLTANPQFTPQTPPPGYVFDRLEGYALPNRDPIEQHVRGHYSIMSSGRMGFSRAGLVRVTFPGGPDHPRLVQDEQVLLAAQAAGVDFQAYDRDGDGFLTDTELTILVITTGYSEEVGGQVRGVPRVQLDGVRTADDYRMAFSDARGDINLYAHELFHVVADGQDIYGPRRSLNADATLMARIARFEQSNGPVRLDPYHRMLAGWGTPPRVMPIDGSGSAILRPEGPPLLFFDGSRGRGEYFLFEHRTPRRRYDGGTTAGVLAWTVAVDAEHRLHTFCWDPPAHDCDRRDMKSAFVVGPAGAGRLPGWMPDDGPFQLTWQNGDPIDLVFEVTQYADGGSVLSWAPAAGFRPRLDRARLSAEQLVVTGNFPDQDGLQVNVAGVVLPFSAHYADRVEFDNTEGLRVGHRVRAFFDGVPSNWLEIEAAAD